MKTLKALGIFSSCFLLYSWSGAQLPKALAAEAAMSSYIMIDIGEVAQKQTVYIYNKGRLETEIQPDHSMISYSYDINGNLLQKSKAYSAEPYIFSTSAVSYDIYLRGLSDSIKQVTFPTWTELNGQDDLKWINGEKAAPGLWKATVLLPRHGAITGIYNTHRRSTKHY